MFFFKTQYIALKAIGFYGQLETAIFSLSIASSEITLIFSYIVLKQV